MQFSAHPLWHRRCHMGSGVFWIGSNPAPGPPRQGLLSPQLYIGAMGGNVDKIKQALLSLNTEELADVIRSAKAAQQFALTPTREAMSAVVAKSGADPYDYVLEWISHFCRTNGTDMRHVSGLKKSQGYPSFKKRAEGVVKFLETFCPTRMHQQVFVQLALSRLALNRPMNATQLMANVHNIPLAVQLMFPGYIESGLMPHLISRLEGPR